MIVDNEDTIHATGATCTATSPENVCPRCGGHMHVVFTDGLCHDAVTFRCWCAESSLSFRDLMRIHGSQTTALVTGACFAMWGDRGVALVHELMKGGRL